MFNTNSFSVYQRIYTALFVLFLCLLPLTVLHAADNEVSPQEAEVSEQLEIQKHEEKRKKRISKQSLEEWVKQADKVAGKRRLGEQIGKAK